MNSLFMIESAQQSQSSQECSLVIGGAEFFGPFDSYISCREQSGILAVFKIDSDCQLKVLNIYQTANVRASALLELSYHSGDEDKTCVGALYCLDLGWQECTQMASSIWKSLG